MTKIYIASCQEFKRGKKKDGSDWVLYHIKDPKGIQYSTFEEKYSAMVGQEVEVEVEETRSEKINPKTNGPYINRNIVEGKRKKGNDNEQLSRIERKLDALMHFQGMTENSASLG